MSYFTNWNSDRTQRNVIDSKDSSLVCVVLNDYGEEDAIKRADGIVKLKADRDALLEALKSATAILEAFKIARIEHLDPLKFYDALEKPCQVAKHSLNRARAAIAQAESEES